MEGRGRSAAIQIGSEGARRDGRMGCVNREQQQSEEPRNGSVAMAVCWKQRWAALGVVDRCKTLREGVYGLAAQLLRD